MKEGKQLDDDQEREGGGRHISDALVFVSPELLFFLQKFFSGLQQARPWIVDVLAGSDGEAREG